MLVQAINAWSPRYVTLSGIVMEVKFLLSANAWFIIESTLLGIVIEVGLLLPNEFSASFVTPSGMI
jgi:hypothetical protein